MEIYKLLFQSFVIVFVGLVSSLVLAKPFSINEALAARGLAKSKSDNTTERYLFKGLKSSLSLKPEILISKKENILPKSKLISLLKNRKPFEIPTLPKSKLLLKKHLSKTLNKRKIQSVKRETNKYQRYVKYIPLLKDIDNYLHDLFYTDTIDSRELDTGESRHEDSVRNHIDSESESVKPCKCNHEPNNPTKKTNSPTATRTTEVSHTQTSEITTERTDHTTFSDVSSLRQNTNIPEVPRRNTSSYGRVRNGVHKNSGAAHHENVERNLTRDNGDSEYDTGREADRTDAEDYEENTDNTTRDGTGGGRRIKRLRGSEYSARDSNIAHQIGKNNTTDNEEAFRYVGKNYERYKIKNKSKIQRNETQYYKYNTMVKGGRFGGFRSKFQDSVSPEFEQSEDNYGESGEAGIGRANRLRGSGNSARDSNSRDGIQSNKGPDNEEAFRDIDKNYERYKIKNKNKARRNKTQHYEYDSTAKRDKLGRLVSRFQDNVIPEYEQSEGNYAESVIDVRQNNTSHQKLFDGNGTSARHNKGNISANRTMIGTGGIETFIFPTERTDNNDSLITINDGYSLTRDTNGESRLSEKVILIKS